MINWLYMAATIYMTTMYEVTPTLHDHKIVNKNTTHFIFHTRLTNQIDERTANIFGFLVLKKRIT